MFRAPSTFQLSSENGPLLAVTPAIGSRAANGTSSATTKMATRIGRVTRDQSLGHRRSGKSDGADMRQFFLLNRESRAVSVIVSCTRDSNCTA